MLLTLTRLSSIVILVSQFEIFNWISLFSLSFILRLWMRLLSRISVVSPVIKICIFCVLEWPPSWAAPAASCALGNSLTHFISLRLKTVLFSHAGFRSTSKSLPWRSTIQIHKCLNECCKLIMYKRYFSATSRTQLSKDKKLPKLQLNFIEQLSNFLVRNFVYESECRKWSVSNSVRCWLPFILQDVQGPNMPTIPIVLQDV